MVIAGANVSFAANYHYEASQQRTQRSVGWADLHPPKRAEAPNSPMSSLREAVAQLEHALEGFQPLLGFLRVGIRNVLHIHGVTFVGFAASG